MALALTILKANDLKNFVHFRAGYFPSPEQLFICRKAYSGAIPSLNEHLCLGLARRKKLLRFQKSGNISLIKMDIA